MTKPLVPKHVDLRDFAFMPLDVVRLRDCDLTALSSDAGFRAAVLLWCAAWHQVPAGSLPDDDRILTRLSGFGRDEEAFASIREEAMRHFIKCDDERFYHPLICKKAMDAWRKKLQAREAAK